MVKQMIRLEKITRENWRKAVFITTDPEHKCPLDETWVTSTAFSIVQSTFEPEWESRLIMEDETIIGFVFYGKWDENRYLLCRYVIDVDFQGQGYGQKALPIVIEHMRQQYGCRDIYLTLEKENERAIHIYEKFGFSATGVADEGEDVYVLRGQA